MDKSRQITITEALRDEEEVESGVNNTKFWILSLVCESRPHGCCWKALYLGISHKIPSYHLLIRASSSVVLAMFSIASLALVVLVTLFHIQVIQVSRMFGQLLDSHNPLDIESIN